MSRSVWKVSTDNFHKEFTIYNLPHYESAPNSQIIEEYISDTKIRLLSLLPILITWKNTDCIKQVLSWINAFWIPIHWAVKNEHIDLLNYWFQSLLKDWEAQLMSMSNCVQSILWDEKLIDSKSFSDSLPKDVKEFLSSSSYDADSLLLELDEVIWILVTSVLNKTIELIKNQEMQEKSLTDVLTKWWNRRSFNQTAEEYFEESLEHWDLLSVILLDLDKFKWVNDRYWHDVWDQVLIQVAEILRFVAKKYNCEIIWCESDTWRVWWEEFWLIFTNKSETEIKEIERTIQRKFLSIQIIERETELPYKISASIWTMTFYWQEDIKTIWEIMKRADHSSYVAKRAGWARSVHWLGRYKSSNEVMIPLKGKWNDIDITKVLLGVSKYSQKFIAKVFSNKYKLTSTDPEPINNLSGINWIYKSIAYFIYVLLDKKWYWEFEWLKVPITNFIQEYLLVAEDGQISFLLDEDGNSHFEQINLLLKSKEFKKFIQTVNENSVTEKCPTINAFLEHLVS